MENLFSLKFNLSRHVILHSYSGNSLNLLLVSNRKLNFFNYCIYLGMELILLPSRLSYSKFLSFSIPSKLDILFLCIIKTLTLGNALINLFREVSSAPFKFIVYTVSIFFPSNTESSSFISSNTKCFLSFLLTFLIIKLTTSL